LDKFNHSGGLAAYLFAHTQSLEGFAADVIHETSHMGYLTLFIYKVMHEMVCIKYRIATDGADPKRISMSSREIQNQHNTTLRHLVEFWKPTVKESTVCAMKVIPDLSSR
jgi:hypothetical protein